MTDEWTTAQYRHWLATGQEPASGGAVSPAEPQRSAAPRPVVATQGTQESPGLVAVRFTVRRQRLVHDRTNLEGGIKFLEDALVHAGLISGDAETQITRTIRQEKVRHRHQEETIVEIEYP